MTTEAVANPLEGVEHVPGVPKPDPVIVADGVLRHFGGLVAVDVDHLEIQRGVITALIGPNGAGKTTFFNLLTGFDHAQAGTREYDGRLLDHRYEIPQWDQARSTIIGLLGSLIGFVLGAFILARADDQSDPNPAYLVTGFIVAVGVFLYVRNKPGGPQSLAVYGASTALGTALGTLFAVLVSPTSNWFSTTMAVGWLIGGGLGIGFWRWATGPLPSYEIAQLGMVRTFQLTKVLARLTVLDNMRLGAPDQKGEHFLSALFQTWKTQEKGITAKADVLLDRFLLSRMRDEYAGTLSGGQRKLLEMAGVLMTDPEVVMLDEPMAGVNPALTQSLLEHVIELPDDGMTVVFVEHDMDVVREISDWVVVMAEGRIIAEGPPDVIGKDQRVIDAYLGAHHDETLEELDRSELAEEVDQDLDEQEEMAEEVEDD